MLTLQLSLVSFSTQGKIFNRFFIPPVLASFVKGTFFFLITQGRNLSCSLLFYGVGDVLTRLKNAKVWRGIL